MSIAAGESLFVPQSVLLASTTGNAVVVSGNSAAATIAGSLYGDNSGFGNSASYTEVTLHVLATGSVASGFSGGARGVTFYGDRGLLRNEGMISGNYGVVIGAPSGGDVTLHNSGTIQGEFAAIALYLTSTVNLTIRNYGTIDGASFAYTSAGQNQPETILNRGIMQGTVSLNGEADRIRQFGIIDGDVAMGTGNDTLNNQGEITGIIDMGAGVDLFIAGRGEEVVTGGTERDVLDLRAARVGVEFDMVDSEGNSVTTGDTYSGFEDVNGSYHGDTIRGDAGANLIQGRSGWDDLNGRGGADVLIGGWGRDTLTGGGGNDRFRYNSVEHGGDTITDFNATFDDIWIAVAGFGGGLVAGALPGFRFRARADNLAQDADDRFIFRTTDATLWFDANGAGGGGLLMVADLQAGAVVTAADIVLV